MTSNAIHPSTVVTLTADDDILTMTMGEFFAANEDGIDADERTAIIATLGRGKVYSGGGGAAGEWTLTYRCANLQTIPGGILRQMINEPDVAVLAHEELGRREIAMDRLRAAL